MKMSRRSAEGDTLDDLNHDINSVLANNLDSFAGAVCSQFVPRQTVDGVTSQHGVSNYSKAKQIMSTVKSSITVQASEDRITKKFDDFELLLRNLKLDDLADLLQEKLSKCGFIQFGKVRHMHLIIFFWLS